MRTLGVPYAEDAADHAETAARAQAGEVFAKLVEEDPTYAQSGLADKKVIALVAYLLRLGTDIAKPPPGEVAAAAERSGG
jgi:cytochrome c oxidase cbb3-type subunit I/II